MIQSQPNPDVLHLVAVPSALSSQHSLGRTIPALLCARALEYGLTPPGRVLLVGESSCELQARLLGLRFDERLAPPLGKVRLLNRIIKQRTKSATRVICWNDELAGVLNALDAESDLISTAPENAPEHLSKKISVRVFEPRDQELWSKRGHDSAIDTLLPPLLDDMGERQRPISRDSIGVDPASLCIGVLADRPSDVDARELAFLLGLLNASGYTITGIVPSTAGHLAAARRHHRGLGSRFAFLISTDPITTLLPVFDALIHPCFDGSGSSMLIERMCDNADVPVLRLRHSSRAGLSRAPSVAAPIIEYLDELIQSKPEPAPAEPAHA